MTSAVKEVAHGGMSGLAAAGLNADFMASAAKSLMSSAVSGLGSLKDSGLMDTGGISDMMGPMMQSAVGALGTLELGGTSGMQDMIGQMMSGAVGGLGDAGVSSMDDVKNAVGNCTSSALAGLSDAGVSTSDMTAMVDNVVSGAISALGDAGVGSAADIQELSSSIASAAISTAVELVMNDSNGGDSGINSADLISLVTKNAASGTMSALGDLSSSGLISLDDMVAATNAVTQEATATLYSESQNMNFELSNDIFSSFSEGMVSGMAMAGVSKDMMQSVSDSISSGVTSALNATGDTSIKVDALSNAAGNSAAQWVDAMAINCKQAGGSWDDQNGICDYSLVAPKTSTVIDVTPPTDPTAISFFTDYTPSPYILLSWTASLDDFFLTHNVKLCGKNDCESQCRPVVTTADASIALTDVPEGTYYACVQGVDTSSNHSAWVASAATITRDSTAPTAPATPTFASLYSKTTTFSLSWTESSDKYFNTHNIKLCTANDCATGCTGSIPADHSPALLTGTNASTYYGCVQGEDLAGNTSAWVASAATLTVDTDAPTPPVAVSAGSKSSSISWNLTFTYTPGSDTHLKGHNVRACPGTNCTALTCTGVFSTSSPQNVGVSADATYHACVQSEDLAGNTSAWVMSSNTVTVNTTSPTITSIGWSSAKAFNKVGDKIDIAVTFTKAVHVINAADLGLTLATTPTNRLATYLSGDLSSTLVFEYTVQAGDSSNLLDYITSTPLSTGAGSGSIKDSDGNNAQLTLPAAGATGSLSAQSTIKVDTTNPTAPTSVGFNSPYATSRSAISLGWTASTDNNFRTHNVMLCTNSSCSTGCTTATEVSGNSVTTLAVSADGTYYGCVQGVDYAGNTSSWGSPVPSITVDTVAPTVTNVSSTKTNGTYTIGTQIDLTVTFSEPVTVTTSGDLGLLMETGTTDRTAIYAGSSSNVLTFRYTVAAGDTSADLDYQSTGALTLGAAGTIKDVAGNNAVRTLPPTGGASSIAGQKAIVINTIDTTAPTPGGSGTVSTSSVTDTSLTLNWTAASDNVTAQNQLQYAVYRSTSSTIMSSVSYTEVYGTLVANYTTNLTSQQATGLSTGTSYYFRVIVKDTAGNKALYNQATATPAPLTMAATDLPQERSSQRKSFYDAVNGRHWSFYADGTSINYLYSTDNVTWTSAGTLAYIGTDFAVTYRQINSTPYVFVALRNGADGIAVRRGVVGASAITFDNEVTAFSGTSVSDHYLLPSIALDTDNYVWVAAVHRNAINTANAFQPRAVKSVAAGNSSLSFGTVNQLGSRVSAIRDLALMPQSSDNMYLVVNSAQLDAYQYTGSSWSSVSTGTTGLWSSYPIAGIGGTVKAVTAYNGNIYIGGQFTSINGDPDMKNIAMWDGTSWHALSTGIDYANQPQINALVSDSSGVYACGNFSSAGDLPAANIAKWTGSKWVQLGTGLSDACTALTLDSTGNLYVGGYFTTAGGVSANYVAKWNMLNSSWEALGSGITSYPYYVYAMTTLGNHMYIGGYFSTVGGVVAANLAEWDGSNWSAMGIGANSPVYGMAASNGKVCVTASYYSTVTIGGQQTNVACWSDGTNSWTNFMNNGTYSPNGQALTMDPAGNVYIGGYFNYACGTNYPTNVANNIVKWDPASPTGCSALGTGVDGEVLTLSYDDNAGRLLVGGSFTSAGGSAANNFAIWSASPGSWSSPSQGSSDMDFQAIDVDGNGNVYVAGNFTQIGTSNITNFAKWDGSNWTTLGSGVQGSINAITHDSQNNIYVGGYVYHAGNISVSNVAKWDSSNATWVALGSGTNDLIFDMAVDGNDNLYVTGYMTTAGGIPVNRIAKWNKSTSSWEALGSGIGTTYGRAVAVNSAGTKVWVGGNFTTAGGSPANYIAEWNGSTSTWSALDTGVYNSSYPEVETLVYDDTHQILYVGGCFSSAGAASTPSGIAAWDGTQWLAMGSGDYGEMYALNLDSSGNVYAGGYFYSIGGIATRSVAKWNRLSSSWEAIGNSTMALDGTVTDLKLDSSGNIYVAGYFTSAGGWPSMHVARFTMGNKVQGAIQGISGVSNVTTGDIHLLLARQDAVYYQKSTGGTWTAPTMLNTASMPRSPVLSYDATNNRMFAFWVDQGSYVWESLFSSGSWGSPYPVVSYSYKPFYINGDEILGGGLVKVMVGIQDTTPARIILRTFN